MRAPGQALFIVLLVAFAAANPAKAEPPLNPLVSFTYDPPVSAGLKRIHDKLKSRKVLEQLSRFLSPLNLPRPLKISTRECGALTKVYTRADGVVIFYEFVARIEQAAAAAATGKTKKQKAKSRRQHIAGAFAQSTLYRVALGLLDELDVPVWGRYTDAADRLAALSMLQFGTRVAQVTLNGAIGFYRDSKKTWTGSDFAEVRSPAHQRMYNYMCMAYGKYPDVFAKIGDELGERIDFDGCKYEYEKAVSAYRSTILPFVDESKLPAVVGMTVFKAEDF